MHLREFIQSGRPLGDPRPPATLATLATLHPAPVPTVATVATVADPGPPEGWPDRLRSLPPADGVRWDLAADALDSLMRAGVVAKALGLGWEARELVGVQRHRPHDHPLHAGLVFSLRPGDAVPDVRRAGCIIAYGNVRHIWKRIPLPADGSICLPWELAK
jgi:hypothetical protein